MESKLKNKEIFKAIKEALKQQNFGEINMDIEIYPIGFLISNDKPERFTIKGYPSNLEITELSTI